jgi:ribonuclease-3
MTPEIIGAVEARLGYVFKDKSLLIRALTRKAYALEQHQKGLKCDDQEIYRTWGDTVLKALLVELLIRHGCSSREALTDRKKSLESRESLGSMEPAVSLAPYMRLGNGERKNQVHQQTSVIGETFEAVIAAIYQDGGHDTIQRLVTGWFEPTLSEQFKHA